MNWNCATFTAEYIVIVIILSLELVWKGKNTVLHISPPTAGSDPHKHGKKERKERMCSLFPC